MSNGCDYADIQSYPVIINNRSQPMSDREDRALREFTRKTSQSIGLRVNARLTHCRIVFPINSSVA